MKIYSEVYGLSIKNTIANIFYKIGSYIRNNYLKQKKVNEYIGNYFITKLKIAFDEITVGISEQKARRFIRFISRFMF